MHRRLQLAIALVLLAGLPAAAKVLAEGKPTSGGYYWQKIEKSNGSIQYMCRNKNDANIQKSAACNGAKAVKPK
jgi:hypothetical protein